MGRGPPLARALLVTYVGAELSRGSAGGEGATGPSAHWGSRGARVSASKEGKRHLGRKREMALPSFVVGWDGGALPLSIEIGAPARRPVGPPPARRRPGAFAGWEAGAGAPGPGRQAASGSGGVFTEQWARGKAAVHAQGCCWKENRMKSAKLNFPGLSVSTGIFPQRQRKRTLSFQLPLTAPGLFDRFAHLFFPLSGPDSIFDRWIVWRQKL